MRLALFSTTSAIGDRAIDVINNLGFDIVNVVTDETPNISTLKNADIMVSVCYHKKIKSEVIRKYPLCINFHPAPLPLYKGMSVYNFGIYNAEKQWGVSAHHITDQIDAGEIIMSKYFLTDNETVQRLRDKSHEALLDLLKDTLQMVRQKKALPSVSNTGGTYYSKKMLDELREIKISMTSDEIKRRIRACRYPPHEGAFMILDGCKFSIDESTEN